MSSMMFGSPTAGFAIVANTRGFRKCPWRVEAVDKFTGKTVRGPAEDVTASLETGPSAGRTTMTRVLTGGLLAGGAGLLLGGLAKKDASYNALVISTSDGLEARIVFPGKDYDKAMRFIGYLREAQAANRLA